MTHFLQSVIVLVLYTDSFIFNIHSLVTFVRVCSTEKEQKRLTNNSVLSVVSNQMFNVFRSSLAFKGSFTERIETTSAAPI